MKKVTPRKPVKLSELDRDSNVHAMVAFANAYLAGHQTALGFATFVASATLHHVQNLDVYKARESTALQALATILTAHYGK